MAIMRSGPGWWSQQTVTLLDSVSPYGSRRLTVEFDGAVTAAYLRDSENVIAATWLANHTGAPRGTDQARLDAGLAPLMPADRTRHPRGRPPLDAATVRAVWFEEGDGVVLLERGIPLAVIPGWADSGHGRPGYSRDVIGQTPFAWPLEDAAEELWPRIERAARFWEWRQSPEGWHRFQAAVLSHLSTRLGPGGHYWDGSRGQPPAVGISERPPVGGREYTVLSTVGMSAQRMPVVEQVLDDPREHARVELALATTLPPQAAALTFPWLATYPWRAVTWFGHGHSVRWAGGPGEFPLGRGYEGVLLLEDPSGLRGPAPPDLSGIRISGEPVRWLWIVPITEQSRVTARDHGSDRLVRDLAAAGRSWVLSP